MTPAAAPPAGGWRRRRPGPAHPTWHRAYSVVYDSGRVGHCSTSPRRQLEFSAYHDHGPPAGHGASAAGGCFQRSGAALSQPEAGTGTGTVTSACQSHESGAELARCPGRARLGRRPAEALARPWPGAGIQVSESQAAFGLLNSTKNQPYVQVDNDLTWRRILLVTRTRSESELSLAALHSLAGQARATVTARPLSASASRWNVKMLRGKKEMSNRALFAWIYSYVTVRLRVQRSNR